MHRGLFLLIVSDERNCFDKGAGNRATSRPQPDVLAMQDVREQGSDTQQQITNEGSTIAYWF